MPRRLGQSRQYPHNNNNKNKTTRFPSPHPHSHSLSILASLAKALAANTVEHKVTADEFAEAQGI
jgi:hypothetical protein